MTGGERSARTNNTQGIARAKTARGHHFLSRCYLKGFAVRLQKKNRYQIQVYDRFERRVFPNSIDNIGKERDFNRIEIEGVAPDTLETGLARFEDKLAPALERAIGECKFHNDEDRAFVLNFVALLALRNPRWRQRMAEFREHTIRLMMDMVLSSKERFEKQIAVARRDGFLDEKNEISYEEVKKFHAEGAFKIEIPNELRIQSEMNGVDALLPHLFKRNWIFLKAAPNSAGFITSDHPVVLVWSDPARTGRSYPPGFGLPGTEVMFPLSTRLAMIGAFEIRNGTMEASEEMVAHLNGAVVATATRQVYARDHNFQYKRSPAEQARKASRLIDDPQFHRERERRETKKDEDSEDAA